MKQHLKITDERSIVKMLMGIFTLIFFVFILSMVLGAFVWPYVFNSWYVYFTHKQPIFVWWEGVLFSFIPYVGRWETAFVCWLITVVAMLVL